MVYDESKNRLVGRWNFPLPPSMPFETSQQLKSNFINNAAREVGLMIGERYGKIHPIKDTNYCFFAEIDVYVFSKEELDQYISEKANEAIESYISATKPD